MSSFLWNIGNIQILLDEVVLNSEADLASLESGGEYFLEDLKNYVLGSVFFPLTKPLNFSNVNTLTTFDTAGSIIPYSGTPSVFKGTFTGVVVLRGFVCTNANTSSIFDFTGNGNLAGNALILSDINFIGFKNKGKVDNIGSTNYSSVQHADCGGGLVFKDISVLSMTNSPLTNSVTSNEPQIVLDGVFSTVRISGLPLITQSGESVIQISKNVSIDSAVINGNQFDDSLGGEFYASAKTGSITVFADNGSGGTTVTSVAHGLTIEQVVEIDNSGVGAYDAMHQDIFNVTTNTFDIPVAFVSNPATGDFDTGNSNIFRDNNAFDSKSNGDDIDTNEISKYKSVNSILITIAGANTPVNVLGNAVDWESNLERRFALQFAGDPNGSLRYIGSKTLSFRVSARITIDVAGGASKEMTGYITLNGVVQTDSKFTAQSGRPITLNPEDIITIAPGQRIGVAIENNDDATNIDVLFANINIIKA